MNDTAPLRIAVASRNPVKVAATERAFRRLMGDRPITLFPHAVPSGVSDQPLTDSETLAGARNRARALARLFPSHDYLVGIEGGIEDNDEGMEAFAWVVIQSGGRETRSRSCSFLLPQEMADLVRGGVELGDASDIVFGTEQSKHDQGAVGLLTHGVIDRTALYEPAVILALAPLTAPTPAGLTARAHDRGFSESAS